MNASHSLKLTGAIFIGLILVFGTSCSLDAIEKKKGQNMDSEKLIGQKGMAPVVESIAAIPDNMFSSQSTEPLVDMVYDNLGGMDYEGVVVKTPQKITWPAMQQVPLLYVSRQSAERSNLVNSGDNCFVAAYHWQRGITACTPCFTDPMEKIPMPIDLENGPPMPPLDDPDGAVAQTSVEVWDLIKIFGTKLETGKFTFAVFVYDWTSNPVSTEIIDIEKKPGAPPKIKVQEVIESMDYFNTEGEPGSTLPDCRRSSFSPGLQANGVRIVSIGTEFDEDTDKAIPLHISFRAAKDESWNTETLSEEAMGDLTKEDETVFTSYPQALAPVSIIISRKNTPTPLKTINRMVPLYSQSGDQNTDIVNGFVSLDLRDELEEDIPEGRYYAYAVVGPYLSVPTHFTILKTKEE